jgi:hypothetical protein
MTNPVWADGSGPSLQERTNFKLRVLSRYRPIPDFNDRPGTVFSQQEQHLRSQNGDRDHQRAFAN